MNQDVQNTLPTNTNIFPLLPLYVVIFIGFVGYSLMITVFTPLLIQGQNGLLSISTSLSERTIILGILLALYPFGQFFGSPILGALSDHFGRKPVLIISLCVSVLCYIFIAIALSLQNLLVLMIALLFAGLAEANVAIAQSAIADVSNENDRSRLFGYIFLSASSAYIIGPLIGGKLAAWFGNAIPFWGTCILLIVTTIWTVLVFRETKIPETLKKIEYSKAFVSIASIFTYPKLSKLYLINFLLYLAIFGFFRCYPMYLVDEFHMDVARESEFIAWVSVPIILANLWLTGFVSRFFSAKIITIVSGLLTGIFMLVVIVPHGENALWVTLFLAAMALSLCLPASGAMLSIAADKSEQGRVMGNNQAIAVGAESLSGLVGGLLAAVVIKLPLIILGFTAIIAAIILLNIRNSNE